MKFAFVLAEHESYPAQTLCRVISASVSGCYAWVGATPLLKARVRAGTVLRERINVLAWCEFRVCQIVQF